MKMKLMALGVALSVMMGISGCGNAGGEALRQVVGETGSSAANGYAENSKDSSEGTDTARTDSETTAQTDSGTSEEIVASGGAGPISLSDENASPDREKLENLISPAEKTIITVDDTYRQEPQTIFDTGEYAATVTGYVSGKDEFGSTDGFTIRVTCENKSSDKTVNFSCAHACVNGWWLMKVFYYAQDVAPGSTVEGEISLDPRELTEYNITSVDQLGLYFTVHEQDASQGHYAYDWMTDLPDYLYPTGKSAGEIAAPERPTGQYEAPVIDNDLCTFCILGSFYSSGISDNEYLAEQGWSGSGIWHVVYYIKNKMDKPISLTLGIPSGGTAMNAKVRINDQAEVGSWWTFSDLAPGASVVSDGFYATDDFTSNGITEVESLEGTLRIDEAGGFDVYMMQKFKYIP